MADAVGQGAGTKLPNSPKGRVERTEETDLRQAQVVRLNRIGNMPQATASLRLLIRHPRDRVVRRRQSSTPFHSATSTFSAAPREHLSAVHAGVPGAG